MSFAYRSIYAEVEYGAATYASRTPAEVLAHHARARGLAPWNHGIRAGAAYFFTGFKLYDFRYQAIATIEDELKVNPYAADLLVALGAYKLASKDEAGAMAALERVKKLRPGLTIVKEGPNGVERH